MTNIQSPNKSSSRSGRFKKKLVSEAALALEAPVIEAKMAPFLELFFSQKITSCELTAIYVLIVLSHRFPRDWAGSKRIPLAIPHQLNFPITRLGFGENILRRLEKFETIGDVFNNFALKSTPETVNRSLLCWSSGTYALELMFKIPTPSEVLLQQKQGRRVVTVLTEQKRTKNFILGERDALSFTMHDLIHADHFYFNNVSFRGQLGLYGLLAYCQEQKHFDDHLKSERFQHEFEYLIADMNAYAVHLLKCLKSALIYFHHEGENFFKAWVENITSISHERDALFRLNSTDYCGSQDDEILLKFLDKWVFTPTRE